MDATISQIKNYFGYTTMVEFAPAWRKLTEEDRTELKTYVGVELSKGGK